MLILMLSVNVGGGSFYLTSAFSGFRLWLIMANKQIKEILYPPLVYLISRGFDATRRGLKQLTQQM